MLKGIIKLACAGAAMLGPFAAGGLVMVSAREEASIVIVLTGAIVGLVGLFGFASIERGEYDRYERARHGWER